MEKALADCRRPLRTQALLHFTVEQGRHWALAGSSRLALAERVQDNANTLTAVDGDDPRTTVRARGHRARSWWSDVARLVGQGST